MASNPLYFDRGVGRDSRMSLPSTTQNASPYADTVNTYPGDSIGTVTERAYGANTPELQDKITRANANLDDSANAPR